MEKLKNIHNCEMLKGNDPLIVWYNQVIEKRQDELTISDVARCIRQNLFVKEAFEMMLVYLLYNPYAGDMYEGELMDKVSSTDLDLIIKHRSTVLEVLEKANKFIFLHEWDNEENKKDYENSVEKLEAIVKEER